MEKTSQLELEAIVTRTQRGEDLEKRAKRPDVLEEYFRRRNEVLAKLGQKIAKQILK